VPEYLAPGVYVEETSFRAKSIEGVGTSTTAFVGPARKGPFVTADTPDDDLQPPEILTSFADFERMYGSLEDLQLGSTRVPNYLAHAVRSYFNEGGSRLYVARIFAANSSTDAGVAAVLVRADASEAERITLRARFPGRVGSGAVDAVETTVQVSRRTLQAAPEGSLLRRTQAGTPPTVTLFVKVGQSWFAVDGTGVAGTATDLVTAADGGELQLLTLAIVTSDGDGAVTVYDDMGYDSRHPRYLGRVLDATPSRRAEQLENLYAFDIGAGVNAFELHAALFAGGAVRADGFLARRIDIAAGGSGVTAGNDGAEPTSAAYEKGLRSLLKLEDVAIVAAPGSAATAAHAAVQRALIAHAESRRAYRIAVLDTEDGITVGEARSERAQIDSTRAALYYPWVVVANPLARPGREDIPKEIALPPSGFVCGIYARNDIERGVVKAPANEVVRAALRFERDVSFGEQELLNPLGVNCLRFFAGRGYRVWGARTASSDPEWKYVNVRRYFNYLEASIDRGTQWAVFEPNGERLWANVRQTIADFLYNEWRNGALLGTTPEQAFFVKCDRSTMTQNDLDNGRLICLIGVAVLKPAEFVIFRIGQKTADARE